MTDLRFALLRPATLAIALSMCAAASTHAAPPSDGYKMCLENNAQGRKNLEAAPGMPEVSKRLALLVIDDRICECIKSQETPSTGRPPDDPMLRFLAANSVCLAGHVNREFPSACPGLYRDLLPIMGYPPGTAGQINQVCACAADVMKHNLTAEALLQSQLDQYRYFKALVADRQNHTRTADAVRPGPGAFERGVQGIRSCAITVLGAPANAVQ